MVKRADFEQAVKNFKIINGKKLKHLLNPHLDNQIQDFLSVPVIQDYFSHPSQEESRVAEKVYHYLVHVIPFYAKANQTMNIVPNPSSLNAAFEQLINFRYKSLKNTTVFPLQEITELPFYLKPALLNPNSYHAHRFIIHYNLHDTQPNVFVTVWDVAHQRPLLTILVGSNQSVDHFELIKEQMARETHQEINFADKRSEIIKNYLQKCFKVDLKKILKNQEVGQWVNGKEKVTLTTNCLATSTVVHPVMKDQIETIFSLSSRKMIIKHANKCPFIDASHRIQVDESDKNGYLYALNFIEAIVTYLENPDHADEVYALAHKVDEVSLAKMTHIFREKIKAGLPCYYNDKEDVKKKSSEIQTFHQGQWFDLNAELLSIRFPTSKIPLSSRSQLPSASIVSYTDVSTIFFPKKGIINKLLNPFKSQPSEECKPLLSK